MDRLNYFASFARQAPHWENQITRALLVVMRHVPLTRAIFVEVIRERQRVEQHGTEAMLPPYLLHGGNSVGFDTQVTHIETPAEGRLTSILLTDQGEVIAEDVRAVERGAVYDGVLSYGDQVIVIENKPHGSSGARQVNPAMPEGERYSVNPRAVVIVWRDLLAAYSQPLLRNDISGAEAMILRDFLDYVQEKAPQLYPYSTIAVCGENLDLLNNRIRQVMEDMAPGAVKYHQGWGYYIQVIERAILMVRISAESSITGPVIQIELHPGDSQRQAKQLYRDDLDVDLLLNLTRPVEARRAWDMQPNFHYAYRASNICFPEHGGQDLEAYLHYWVRHRDQIAQIKRETDAFEGVYQRLVAGGIISDAGLQQLRSEVSSKKYDRLNVCPGLSIYYRLPLAEAADLDAREGRLGTRLRTLLVEAFESWGQEFLPVPPTEELA